MKTQVWLFWQHAFFHFAMDSMDTSDVSSTLLDYEKLQFLSHNTEHCSSVCCYFSWCLFQTERAVSIEYHSRYKECKVVLCGPANICKLFSFFPIK